MKCRFGRGLLVALLLMILLFYPMLAPPVHRIDSEHYALIRNGMSLVEVESIFGVPAENYDWAVPKSQAILFGVLVNNVPNLTFASGSLPLTIDAHQVSGAFVSTADFDKDGMPDPNDLRCWPPSELD